MTIVSSPTTQPDHTPHLPDADRIVDGLPWIVGRTPSQHRATRGRAAALVSQIAQMLESGWTSPEIVAVLDSANMDGIGNAEGQEARWRKSLKAARAARGRDQAQASDETAQPRPHIRSTEQGELDVPDWLKASAETIR